MKMKVSRKAGFTLVEIMIVVAIIGLLAAIAIPNFVRARQTSQTNVCINNLRQIDGAKQQWALENGKQASDSPDLAAITPYLGRGSAGSVNNLYCTINSTKTAGAGYTIGTVGTAPSDNNYNATTHAAQLQ
ncbi:MAG: prepilin-type N-terminal cleavage/methylation domain-containing protein [Verrucomicrobiota bacterium]